MKKILFPFFLSGFTLVLAAGCAVAGKSASPDAGGASAAQKLNAAASFDYDPSVPFDVAVASETVRDGVTITDLSYAAHDPEFSPSSGARTLAYLVKPQGDGPFPAVIYIHWLGQGRSNRDQYLEEAVELAGRGFVSLLPQGYFPWMVLPMGEQDRSTIIGQVVEFRRAVDFLIAQPSVDPGRIGCVGHDYGAEYAAILAGVDLRIKASVLIAGTPSFADWIVFFQYPRDVYDSIVVDLDPILYVPHAAPGSLLFQFAGNDAVVPREKALAFFAAASEPKQIEWYEDIHNMLNPEARRARMDWLSGQLEA